VVDANEAAVMDNPEVFSFAFSIFPHFFILAVLTNILPHFFFFEAILRKNSKKRIATEMREIGQNLKTACNAIDVGDNSATLGNDTNPSSILTKNVHPSFVTILHT
jgi:hypothetical protein